MLMRLDEKERCKGFFIYVLNKLTSGFDSDKQIYILYLITTDIFK